MNDRVYQLVLPGFEVFFSVRTSLGPGMWGIWTPFMRKYF